MSTDQLASYFADLVDSHSWSTVKVDRNGLQFFYKHVLKRDWTWVEIIKAPKIQSLPDILTLEEIGRLINAIRKLRYRALRSLWSRHRNPLWLFANALGSSERIAGAGRPMDRGGAQAAMKAVVQSCGIKKSLDPFTTP